MGYGLTFIRQIVIILLIGFTYGARAEGDAKPQDKVRCAYETRVHSFLQLKQDENPLFSYLTSALESSGLVGAATGAAIGAATTPRSTNPEFQKYLDHVARGAKYDHLRAAYHKAHAEMKSRFWDIHTGVAHLTFEKFYSLMQQDIPSLSRGRALAFYEQIQKTKDALDRAGLAREEFRKSTDAQSPAAKKLYGFLFDTPEVRRAMSLYDDPKLFDKADESTYRRSSEMLQSQAKKVALEHKAFPPGERPIGKMKLRGAAGGAAGFMVGEAVDHIALRTICGLESFGQAHALAGKAKASLAEGCMISSDGSRQLAGMEQKDLEDLCEKVPNLANLANESFLKRSKEAAELPKFDSIEPNCSTGSIRATVSGGRTYDLKIARGVGDDYSLTAKVSGKLSKPVDFTAEFDGQKFTSIISREARMGKVMDQEKYLGAYRAYKGENQGGSREPVVITGEGLNVAKALAKPLAAHCLGGGGNPSSDSKTVGQAR